MAATTLPLMHWRLRFGSAQRDNVSEPPVSGAARQQNVPPPMGQATRLTAADVMTRDAPVVSEDARLAAVAALMLQRSVDCVLVVDREERLRGIITEDDFTPRDSRVPFTTDRQPRLFGEWVSRRGIEDVYAQGRWVTAGEVMHAPVVTVAPTTPISEVVDIMRRRGVGHLPVVRGGMIEGIVSRHDLLKLLIPGPAADRSAAGR
jgi:CBS domain-containing protein